MGSRYTRLAALLMSLLLVVSGCANPKSTVVPEVTPAPLPAQSTAAGTQTQQQPFV